MKKGLFNVHQELKMTCLLFEMKQFQEGQAQFQTLRDRLMGRLDTAVINQIQSEIEALNFGTVIHLLKKSIHAIGAQLFSFRCDQSWNSLEKTEHKNARFCGDCQKHVYAVRSKEEFYSRARNGQCVYLEFDPQSELTSSEVCVITMPEIEATIGMPEPLICSEVSSEFLHYLKLLIEQKDYSKLMDQDLYSLEMSGEKNVRKAYKNIQLNNFEAALWHIEEYFLLKEMEEYGREEMERSNQSETFQPIKNQNMWVDDEPNDSFCSACQQDPCMCSDPY